MSHVIFIENEEQRLVKRLQEGDKSAAREFYARYADSLAGVCARYIANAEDMKDVFQNALVHIFSNIAGFEYRREGSLEAWAKRVVVNESLKFLRRKGLHKVQQLDGDVIDEVEEDILVVNDIPPDVIQKMLNRLPTGYRTVLNLYVFEGKSHQEIARMLGIGKDSSASQLLRARSMLIKMIKKYNNDRRQRR
jgi:RNA polymerase sigma-70 factor (ECF subfamily)